MQDRQQLAAGWQLCATAPGAFADPKALTGVKQDWLPTTAPSTAASSLRAAGRWTLDEPARRFDADDWWYHLTFATSDALPISQAVLGFDGLATVADAWLNGQHILRSENMFVAHECAVGHLLTTSNELFIRFRALDDLLKAKRARPRWRAPMIENQQLRWFRATVLGRTPGWSPPCAAVGPWRGAWLELQRANMATDVQLTATIQDDDGIVTVNCLPAVADSNAGSVKLRLMGHGVLLNATLTLRDDGRYTAELVVPDPKLWWPHTHGEPALYHVTLQQAGTNSAATEQTLGAIGFRTLEVDTAEGNFAVKVNGVRVFCRGACWTPLDPVSLQAEPAAYDQTLAQVKDAGMNMLRVGGTMVYESDAFYDRCDALGILVWQDFMFANMDYPEQDASFVQSATLEAEQILARLRHRPSVAVLCGNSEVEQQAAMWGAPRERWSPPLFHELLRDLCARHCPNLPYWPSSAHGGAFPHQNDSGTTSYYGVGAYLRPLEDARRSGLRFATECLAFANVPEAATIQKMPGGLEVQAHHPGWKQRSPRDLGAGWDFDDVRDHYLTLLFSVDPRAICYADHERYLALSRATVDHVVASAFNEWRRKHSACNGALIWFLRDLWPGAGWGIIGSDGIPKSAYYALRRVLQPVSVAISDEGTNGLFVHVTNEHVTTLEALLTIKLYRNGEQVIGEASRALRVPPRNGLQIIASELFDDFHDLSYAYRFGPPAHDLVKASLHDASGAPIAEHCYLPQGVAALGKCDLGLLATVRPLKDGARQLTVSTRRYAHGVSITAYGFGCRDQYFNLAPGTEIALSLSPTTAVVGEPMVGQVHALNAISPVSIQSLA